MFTVALKVMAGDKLNIRASSWYRKNYLPGNNDFILTDLLSNLTAGIAGQSSGKILQTQLSSSGSPVSSGVSSFLSNQNCSNYDDEKPMAYLNWILFDEQFKYVASSSGSDQVGDDDEFKVHTINDLEMTKNGYLFVYVSNASTSQPVYFDNLQVTHVRGPILEETHSYPFGLIMTGISAEAHNFGGPENKKNKFQNQEFSDDLGVPAYEFKYRMDDLQIGRFWQVDPLSDKYVYNSTYAFSENKVTSHVEMEGLEAITITGGISGMIGPLGAEYSAGLAFNGEGIAPITQSGNKNGFGINACACATIGFYTTPTLKDLAGQAVTAYVGGGYMGDVTLGWTDMGDYSGISVSGGFGGGFEVSITTSDTWVGKSKSWNSAFPSLGFTNGKAAFDSFKEKAMDAMNKAIGSLSLAVMNVSAKISNLTTEIKDIAVKLNKDNFESSMKEIEEKANKIEVLKTELKEEDGMLSKAKATREKIGELQFKESK